MSFPFNRISRNWYILWGCAFLTAFQLGRGSVLDEQVLSERAVPVVVREVGVQAVVQINGTSNSSQGRVPGAIQAVEMSESAGIDGDISNTLFPGDGPQLAFSRDARDPGPPILEFLEFFRNDWGSPEDDEEFDEDPYESENNWTINNGQQMQRRFRRGMRADRAW